MTGVKVCVGCVWDVCMRKGESVEVCRWRVGTCHDDAGCIDMMLCDVIVCDVFSMSVLLLLLLFLSYVSAHVMSSSCCTPTSYSDAHGDGDGSNMVCVVDVWCEDVSTGE